MCFCLRRPTEQPAIFGDTSIPSICCVFFCLNALSAVIGTCTIILMPGSDTQEYFDELMVSYCDSKEKLQLDTLHPPSMLRVRVY